MKLANVIVDISHEAVDRYFQYGIPEEILPVLKVGMKVAIPFGKGNTKRTGYVIEITDIAEYPLEKMKMIADVIGENDKAEYHLVALAQWMKEQYGSTMITALKTVLPIKDKVKQKVKRQIVFLKTREEGQQLLAAFSHKNQKAKVRLLERLLVVKEIDYGEAIKELQISKPTIDSLHKDNIIEVIEERSYRNPVQLDDIPLKGPKILSDEQQKIVATVMDDFASGIRKNYLIHGITGSGKTEVYLGIIENMILANKQVIMLIPEIALTYQTVLRFYERFGNRVSIMNSTLSKGEKYDQFERVKKGEIDIVIGPRSALFMPFQNLGCIIIDEEHESSYKSEAMPKYHTRDVAIELARLSSASVILGSATPSLESYYEAKEEKMELFTLQERLAGGTLPTVYIVDLREELKKGNRTIFSNQLQQLIGDRLDKKEQVMIFLNRRGYAGFISCRSCGHVMKCPHCDISLSEHKGGRLVCHYCGYEEATVKNCPICGSQYISGFRAGTEQIEEQMKRLFPTSRILRMDGDTTKTKDSYEKILSAFSNQEADILIGTQMIVKGHDFKNVTLVGVIAADLSLAANDYRASERTFQLLTQAAGRAGRGEKPGEVVIQTYQPEHYSIIHAANQDYENFYQEEMVYREMMDYPPSAHILSLQILSEDEMVGKKMATILANGLKNMNIEHVIIIGPVQASIGKIRDIYRHAVYCKSQDKENLIRIKDKVEAYMKKANKKGVLVQFDFDPVNPY